MKRRALIWAAVSTRPQANEDKYSIRAQIEDGRMFADKEGMDVVDELVVPGHSRRYFTLEEVATAGERAKEPVLAFRKLQRYVADHAFDVFICRDADRFGRKQSLVNEIVGRIYEADAMIYSLNDGWIEAKTAPLWSTMKGFASERYVDDLVEKRKRGMQKRLERGKTISPRVHPAYRRIYDSKTGDEAGLVVREELLQVWYDAGKLLLEGVGWSVLEAEMFRRFGHGVNGKPYWRNFFHAKMRRPVFWGHMAMHYTQVGNRNIGAWVFDESEPVPEGVDIVRNTHEPVLKGEFAEAIKSEIKRRMGKTASGWSPTKSHMFTSLCVCSECGSNLTNQRNRVGGGDYRYLQCREARYHNCSQSKTIRRDAVQAWVDARLHHWLQSGEFNDLLGDDMPDESDAHLARLTKEHAMLQRRIDALIEEQLEAEQDLKEEYRRRVRATKDRLDAVERDLDAARHEQTAKRQQYERQATLRQDLTELTLEEFWKQEELAINQFLCDLLGDNKIVITLNEKRIRGFVNLPKKLPRR